MCICISVHIYLTKNWSKEHFKEMKYGRILLLKWNKYWNDDSLSVRREKSVHISMGVFEINAHPKMPLPAKMASWKIWHSLNFKLIWVSREIFLHYNFRCIGSIFVCFEKGYFFEKSFVLAQVFGFHNNNRSSVTLTVQQYNMLLLSGCAQIY